MRLWNRPRSRGVAALLAAGMVLGMAPTVAPEASAQESQEEDALAQAAVVQEDLSDIGKNGYILGNGDLMAIVYTEGDDLCLRASKNDFWDDRINTEGDEMPTVNASTGEWTAGTPSGSGEHAWDNIYPTGLNTGLVRFEDVLSGGLERAVLDLETATVTLELQDGTDIQVRALAQENAFYVETETKPTMEKATDYLVDPVVGTDEATGYTYLTQEATDGTFDDPDVDPANVYMVSGGNAQRQIISVVTDRESDQPMEDARDMVTQLLDSDTAVEEHNQIWADYWAQSSVTLEDKELERWWYRMTYYVRTFSQADGDSVGLKAGFESLAGWHNSLKLNYNTQQTYSAAVALNHPELLEPFIDTLNRNLPRAKWFAKTNFTGVTEGAFFHSDIWPFEPDVEESTSDNHHQLAYSPWGYTWGMQGHIASVIWEYYTYQPTQENLDRVYDLVKEFALFYCSILEQCSTDETGKLLIGPSYFPEDGAYGQYNNAYDIAYINAGLKIGREALELKGEPGAEETIARIDALLEKMPYYGTVTDEAQGGQTVVEDWMDHGVASTDRHGSLIQAIYPANEVTWYSDAEEKELFQRTINLVEQVTTHANSNVILNIARARLSMGEEAIENAKMCFSSDSAYSPEQPNGLFYWNAHGYYMSEQVAIARLISELLVQSVDDVIRVFPAWPQDLDGQFQGLRTQGGFLVSADQTDGLLTQLEVTSTAGGVCTISCDNLSTARVVNAAGESVDLEVVDQNTVRFDTVEGETYRFEHLPQSLPQAPQGVTAQRQDESTVAVTWKAVDDAQAYRVYRSVNDGFEELVATVEEPAYLDENAVPDWESDRFTYQITTVDALGVESLPSTSAQEQGLQDYMVDSGDDAVQYTGQWEEYTEDNHYQQTNNCSWTSGSTAELTFTGSGIALYSVAKPNYNGVYVYIDGVKQEGWYTVQADETQPNFLVYQNLGLDYGTHTIRVEVMDQVVTGVKDCSISIDYFKVYGRSRLQPVEDQGPNGYDLDLTDKQEASLERVDGSLALKGSFPVDNPEAKEQFTQALSGDNSFTFESEIYIPADAVQGWDQVNMIASKGDYGAAMRVVGNDGEAKITFYVHDGSDWTEATIQLDDHQLGRWLHVAGGYDAQQENIFVWVDGERQEETGVAQVASTDHDLYLGYCPDTQRNNELAFRSFRVYSKALSDQELTQDTHITPADDGVLLWYDFAGPDAPTVTSVTVTPQEVEVEKGQTQTFTAQVVGDNQPTQEVTWTVTGGHSDTNIDENGLLTVSPEEKAETLTVTATSTLDPTKSGTATVTVVEPPHQHTPEILEGKPATCTQDGLTQGSRCSTCGEILIPQQVIPATGHHFVDGSCTVCGEADPDYHPSVNKTLLQKTYDDALTLDTTGVAESAVALFEKALAEAKDVLDDPNATQAEVNTAWDNLLEGIWALGLKQGDKTMLELLIARADDMMDNAAKYVDTNWQQLVDALQAAKAVMADGDALQNDVDQAADALLDAILAQRFKADKSILEELIGTAQGLSLEGYTAQSVATFRTALATAQAVMADNSLTEEDQTKVDAAVTALNEAINGLTADTTDRPQASQKPESTEKPENVPQTGDSAQLTLWVMALVFSSGAGLWLMRHKARKSN